MIYRSTFTSHQELAPLTALADKLAEVSDWPQLYSRQVLARNTVPVYAAVYKDDMYVDFAASLDTANAIRGCKTFVTNMMYHDGIRAKSAEVLAALWKLRDDVMD